MNQEGVYGSCKTGYCKEVGFLDNLVLNPRKTCVLQAKDSRASPNCVRLSEETCHSFRDLETKYLPGYQGGERVEYGHKVDEDLSQECIK